MLEIKALQDERIYQTTLASGLRVAIHPKTEFHNIYASFQIDFGGSDLRYHKDGIERTLPGGVAHFLEHLMFHNLGIELPEVFADLGAEVNAYTSKSNTAYRFKTINNIQKLLKIFIENFRGFQVEDEIIEKERRIIVHELTMSDDSVHYDMQQALTNMMYSDYCITSDVGGKVKDVRSVTKEDLVEAFNTFYHPCNCSLVITGNVEVNQVMAILEDNEYELQTWPSKPEIMRVINDASKRIHHKTKYTKDLPENMITYALKIPQVICQTIDREFLHIAIGSIVANVFSLGSKTFDYLEKSKLMNVSFFTKLTIERDYGYFDIFIQTSKVKRYIKTMEDILLKVATEPLDEEFFVVNKKNIIGNYITMFDSLSRSHDFLCNCVQENIQIDDYLNHVLNLSINDLDQLKLLFVKENIYLLSYLKAKKK